MYLKNYYYHTILINSIDEFEIYNHFEIILKEKYLKAKKFRNNEINDYLFKFKNNTTYNGSDFISFASYIDKSEYKVEPIEKKAFKDSELSMMFDNYESYLDYLKLESKLEQPLSREDFFLKYNTSNKREYFNYLDTISRTYPVDIKYLFNKTSYEIYEEILKNIDNTILYCFRSEYAFDKAVLESKSITFIFPNNIKAVKVKIIPNLPTELENKVYKDNLDLKNNYSNLIGEVQVKNKIAIDKAIGIIIKNNLDIKIIKSIIKKYGYCFNIYKIIDDKLEIINE